jgi:hypothetical protein
MPTRGHAYGAIVASLCLALGCGGTMAAPAGELYSASAFVTGQVEPGRSKGFARCLTEVLVKVSGDPGLADDPRLAEITGRAGSLVIDFTYRDLMAGIPVHDEQGTRDRPYELTVTFNSEKVDATLRALGREPWLTARPRVALFLGVRQLATEFTLASDETRGPGMREAIASAAAGVGIPVVLPDRAALNGAGFTAETSLAADPSSLTAAVKAAGGDMALVGTLTWNDAAMGWIADWRMDAGGREHRWQIRGVNFDDAFRSGMRGAVQILASQTRGR